MSLLRAKIGYFTHSHLWAETKKSSPWHSLCGLKRFRSELVQDVNDFPRCQRCEQSPRSRSVTSGVSIPQEKT